MAYYEPPPLEVALTLGLGLTLLSPYYRHFAKDLNLQGNERVIDFGSGSGICSRHIARQLKTGGQLHCVDISHTWQKVIRKTLKRYEHIQYYCGRISELNLPDHSFDVIVIHFVLHDIPDSQRDVDFRNLAEKLNSGGRIIFREPLTEGFTRQSALELTKKAGLEIKSIESKKIAMTEVIDGCLISNNNE